MYAIIDTGNNQEKVEIGSKIEVDFISDKKKGDTVKFDKVLLLSDGKTPKIGKPYVAKAFVSGKVLDHAKKDKVYAIPMMCFYVPRPSDKFDSISLFIIHT